jgi:hypothetical protein
LHALRVRLSSFRVIPIVVAKSGDRTISGDVIDLKMRYINNGTGAALNTVFSMSYEV